jgi:hypothetical protein
LPVSLVVGARTCADGSSWQRWARQRPARRAAGSVLRFRWSCREAQGLGNCWSARCGTRCLASPAPARVSAGAVRAGLDGALADFRDSRYGRLSATLPRLISAGHVLAAGGGDSGQRDALLAGIYTLTTRTRCVNCFGLAFHGEHRPVVRREPAVIRSWSSVPGLSQRRSVNGYEEPAGVASRGRAMPCPVRSS